MSEEEIRKAMVGSPDFTNPGEVVKWFGGEIIRLLGQMTREKAGARLRALNSAVDSWSRAYRLSADTVELQQLKQDLDELRQHVEAERGIRIVKGGKS